MKLEEKLCRLCAERKQALLGIYEPEGHRLDIEAKISKCLRIQIYINDGLPLFICNGCCLLLDQCNEFYEKTNQAQSSLRRMFLEPQVEVHQKIFKNSDTTIEPEENCSDLYHINIKEDYDAEDVIDKEYLDDNNEVPVTNDPQDNARDVEESDCINSAKKDSSKLNNKKKAKRKNISIKIRESNLQNTLSSETKEDNDKNNLKIPENYMTGTESDMEIIIRAGKKSDSEQTSPPVGRRKGQKLDRYPWLCTDCNDKLPSLEALEDHHQTIHNQKAKYMCVQCCKVYEKYYGFLTHVKRHKTKAKFSCDECGKTFVHKKVLDTHKAIHSEERPHSCQTCGKAFRQQSALYIHSRCHLPENMKNRYPCDQCDKRFSTKPNLVTHKRIHSGVRNFTCDQCGKSFIQKGNLEAHFLTHSSDKPHKCSQCPKAFKTPLQLKKHETVHTGAKPHQCAVCGRTFREKGTLREHHRIHTGAMPFSCEFCGKCFRFKGILTTHRRQHTGERPYSCMECQHHFTNWPNYNKHMKRRHGINTSSAKYQQQNLQGEQQQEEAQQNLQEQHQHQQQEQQVSVLEQQLQQPSQMQIVSSPENHPSMESQVTTTTVQVIQTVPQVTVPPQPLILQSLQSTGISTIPPFTENLEVTTSLATGQIIQSRQQPVMVAPSVSIRTPYHSSTNATSYFNAISTPLSSFITPNLPYNFYSIPNVAEPDLVQQMIGKQ